MRVLIGILLLLLASAAPSQVARLTLEDGSTMQGTLVEVGEQRVQLRVEGRVVTVPIAKIVDFAEVDPGATPQVGGPALIRPAVPDQDGTPSAVTSQSRSPDLRSGPESLFASRLGWISERHSWIPADDVKSVASVGMIFLLLLACLFHFATAVTSVEAASFQRALVLAIAVVSAAAALIGFVPDTQSAMLWMAGGSLLGWVVLTKVVYEARFIQMIWLALALAVSCVVSLLLLELVSGVMGMLDSGNARTWDS